MRDPEEARQVDDVFRTPVRASKWPRRGVEGEFAQVRESLVPVGVLERVGIVHVLGPFLHCNVHKTV